MDLNFCSVVKISQHWCNVTPRTRLKQQARSCMTVNLGYLGLTRLMVHSFALKGSFFLAIVTISLIHILRGIFSPHGWMLCHKNGSKVFESDWCVIVKLELLHQQFTQWCCTKLSEPSQHWFGVLQRTGQKQAKRSIGHVLLMCFCMLSLIFFLFVKDCRWKLACELNLVR